MDRHLRNCIVEIYEEVGLSCSTFLVNLWRPSEAGTEMTEGRKGDQSAGSLLQELHSCWHIWRNN